MEATIVTGDRIVPCEFQYPHLPSPISIPLPGGTRCWQPSPYARYDVLIVMPIEEPVLLLGTIEVMTEKTLYTVNIENPKGQYLYGSLIEKRLAQNL